jgi:hypothetical protein
MVRSSYGLCGVVYEVTLRVKPIEALHFTYLPRPVDDLTQEEVDSLLDTSEGLICWTVGRTCIFQRRHRVDEPGILGSLLAAARRGLWSYGEAHAAHLISQFISDKRLRDSAQEGLFDATNFLYATLHLFGGITLLAPDKTEIFSIDPIHASTDDAAWHNFLRQFNDFAYQRHGIPLLNQSPFVERKHVEAAYGQRWLDFCGWVRTMDPTGRMLNPFFADLLTQRPTVAQSGGT